jgi:shikimate kinase
MTATDKIFLIGFMGSGKSTHGKKLAKSLERPFIDLDNYIEGKEGFSVQNIFEHKGENYFRQRETEYLKQVIARYATSVISLGGGAPCFNDNMELLLKTGIVIYIKMPAEALFSRLNQSASERPLLKDKTEAERLDLIKKLLPEREPFYSRAHITVNGLDLTTEKLKEAVSLHIGRN